MAGRWHAAACVWLLMLLSIAAMDDQHPFTTPGSTRDLQNQREAARERTRAQAEQDGERSSALEELLLLYLHAS